MFEPDPSAGAHPAEGGEAEPVLVAVSNMTEEEKVRAALVGWRFRQFGRLTGPGHSCATCCVLPPPPPTPKPIYTAAMAAFAYSSFCQIIGQETMRRAIVNSELIEQLMYDHLTSAEREVAAAGLGEAPADLPPSTRVMDQPPSTRVMDEHPTNSRDAEAGGFAPFAAGDDDSIASAEADEDDRDAGPNDGGGGNDEGTEGDADADAGAQEAGPGPDADDGYDLRSQPRGSFDGGDVDDDLLLDPAERFRVGSVGQTSLLDVAGSSDAGGGSVSTDNEDLAGAAPVGSLPTSFSRTKASALTASAAGPSTTTAVAGARPPAAGGKRDLIPEGAAAQAPRPTSTAARLSSGATGKAAAAAAKHAAARDTRAYARKDDSAGTRSRWPLTVPTRMAAPWGWAASANGASTLKRLPTAGPAPLPARRPPWRPLRTCACTPTPVCRRHRGGRNWCGPRTEHNHRMDDFAGLGAGHTGAVRSITVAGSERAALTACKDRTVKLWSLDLDVGAMSATAANPVLFGDCRQTYSAHKKGVLRAAWFGNERTVVSADAHAIHVRR